MKCVKAALFLTATLSLVYGEIQVYEVHSDGKSLPHASSSTSAVHRAKRQAPRRPIRITPFYDSTVEGLDAGKRNMIEGDIIPDLIAFLAQVLSVTPSEQPIRLNSQCTDGRSVILTDGSGRVVCSDQCLTTTRCGVFPVSPDHLNQCLQCNGQRSSCDPQVGTPSEAGTGVANTDFVLYVSASQTACPPLPVSPTGPTTVAFASHCQLESTLDRPVAGNVNFCPEGIVRNINGLQYISDVTKHEILHAIGFSSSLFPFWHDANGNPRTPRENGGLPTVASDETIRMLTYSQWQTNSGLVSHNISAIVTPNVVMAGRNHFGCSDLEGVELENQGGPGTMGDHWEKRLLGNEAMTGVFTFNPVFSNITLAALQDSGWYDVDFTMAEDLAWGRGMGCDFVRSSCAGIFTTQAQQNGENGVFPFCNEAGRLGCTADRLSVAQCNRRTPAASAIDSQFQYFSDATSGGGLAVADFCPYYQMVTLNSRSPVCSNQANSPSTNDLLESYGSSSRCLTHGRDWQAGGRSAAFSGGGCYQYSCSRSSGVTITIAGRSHTCSCTGEEVVVDLVVNGVRHTGSVICPACQDICHDSLDQCPTTESSCYGRVSALGSSSPSAAGQAVVSTWLMLVSLFQLLL